MTIEPQMLFVMLGLPTLFGLTLLGEGVYKMTHYESGWMSMLLGCAFLAMVAFGYFYMAGGFW